MGTLIKVIRQQALRRLPLITGVISCVGLTNVRMFPDASKLTVMLDDVVLRHQCLLTGYEAYTDGITNWTISVNPLSDRHCR